MEKVPHFKIIILEDDDFYNGLLSRFVHAVMKELSLEKRFTYELQAYTTYSDCSPNVDATTSLVIADYYLDTGGTPSHLIHLMEKRPSECKVVIMSRQKDAKKELESLLKGTYEFFQKDTTLFNNCRDMIFSIVMLENEN